MEHHPLLHLKEGGVEELVLVQQVQVEGEEGQGPASGITPISVFEWIIISLHVLDMKLQVL